MKTRFLCALAALALLAPMGSLRAQEVQLTSHAEMTDLYARLADLEARVAGTNMSGCGCADAAGSGCGCDTGCNGGSNGCGCNGSGCNGSCGCSAWFADVEFNFFQYNRSVGFTADDTFNHQFSPRLTLGYVGDSGFGARLRYWEFDQNSLVGAISVDTYNFDTELFQNFEWNDCTNFQLSAGIRINEFIETGVPGVAPQRFLGGFGGIFGARFERTVLGGNIYGRTSVALLTGDWFEGAVIVPGGSRFDAPRSQFEYGIGYEYDYCMGSGGIITLRAGYEWQVWSDYVSAPVAAGIPSDVGFNGIVLGAAYSY